VLSWTGRTFIPQRRSRRSVQQGHPTWGTDYVTIGAVESFRQWNNRVYAEPKGMFSDAVALWPSYAPLGMLTFVSSALRASLHRPKRMLQSKLRQAIGGMEAYSAQRLFGSVRGDIDFDEGVVGSDILSAFLTYACVKHWSILSLRFTSFLSLGGAPVHLGSHVT
jgi:hypothetical protein